MRDEIESPFRTHHRSRLRHPFSTTGEKEEEEEEGKENCKYRDQTRNGNEGEGEEKGLENCEEGREGKDENLEGSSKLKEISDDMHVFLPPPHFSTGRNFPGGNFEKQPRREGNFFYRWEGGEEVEEMGEREEFGGRESLKKEGWDIWESLMK